MKTAISTILRLTRLGLPLVVLSLVAIGVRVYADNARDYLKPYMATFFPQEVANLNTLPWWQYLLPIKAFGGRWGTTGFLLVNALEYRFGEPTTFYLLTAVMVIAGYILAYFTFRSLVIATLVGFALGTTTFNYHVYLVSGSVVMLPLVTLLLLFAFFQVQWIRATDKELLWGFLTILSCSLFAICYEGWLDIVPLLWIVYPVLAWYFLYNNLIYTRRCLLILAISTVISLIYVIIKYKAGLDGLHQRGSEADLILTYGFDHKLLMIEDMISSFFTFFYTTVSTYLPPELFSYSLSSWIYGPEKITTLQEGYHSEATHLTHYNHQFLWRYYAGFSLALFAVGYTKVIRRLFRLRQPYYLVLFVLMTATLIGSPTHLIIKWRPMHSTPLLGYQCFLSVVGYTLLLCYVVGTIARKCGGIRGIGLTMFLMADFGYCAYARPSLLSHMSQESFLGSYPDPRRNLRFGH